MDRSRRTFLTGLGAATGALALRAGAARASYDDEPGTYSYDEILDAGHGFFGSISEGLAHAVEHLFESQGQPTGYIVGEEGGGAFVAGLRYGEGTLHTKNAGASRVYWQGPSLGWDVGADGARTMMLIYNLADTEEIYRRFAGLNGSAYLVAGVGVSLYGQTGVLVAPMRTGVGARLGVNVGYLKFTPTPTWNPF